MDIPNPQDSSDTDTPVVGIDDAVLTRHDPFNLNGMFAPIAQGMGL